eukprot:gene1901-2182_t
MRLRRACTVLLPRCTVSPNTALMQRSRVDLPEPDGPIRHTTSPLATSRSTPCSTRWVP